MKFQAWILLLFSTILFYSCSSLQKPHNPETPTETLPHIPEVGELPGTPNEGSLPTEPEYPVANTRKIFTVKIVDLNYSSYSGAQAKLKEASVIITSIFNSIEYKDAVLNHKFKNELKFHDNNGLTNEQIYLKLYAGAESLSPAINYQLDLQVKMYYSKWVSTVGYTYPSDLTVYTNWKYHQGYDACRIASNLVHEWTHKMGFSHDAKYNKDRDFSVPYAHNTIIESLCEKAKKGLLTELK